MYPVNQVILGGESMFNNLDDIDNQIQRMEIYKQRLNQIKSMQSQQVQKSLIWDKIDSYECRIEKQVITRL